jgi:hypothetical protein
MVGDGAPVHLEDVTAGQPRFLRRQLKHQVLRAQHPALQSCPGRIEDLLLVCFLGHERAKVILVLDNGGVHLPQHVRQRRRRCQWALGGEDCEIRSAERASAEGMGAHLGRGHMPSPLETKSLREIADL